MLRLSKEFDLLEVLACIDYPHSTYGSGFTRFRSLASPIEAEIASLVFIKGKSEHSEDKLLDSLTKANIVILEEGSRLKLDGQTVVYTPDSLSLFIRICGVVLKGSFLIRNSELGSHFDSGDVSDYYLDQVFGRYIHKSAIVGDGCSIGSNVFIGPNTAIGDNVTIGHNTSIGVCGLGYHTDRITGERLFFPHLGRTMIGNDCIIGSSCTIVRGQLSDTVLGDAVRLGNQVNIGHNVCLGSSTVISSSSCVSGGAKIGNSCTFGIGSKVNSKIVIGNRCIIGMSSCVTKDLSSGSKVFGVPAKTLPTLKEF